MSPPAGKHRKWARFKEKLCCGLSSTADQDSTPPAQPAHAELHSVEKPVSRPGTGNPPVAVPTSQEPLLSTGIPSNDTISSELVEAPGNGSLLTTPVVDPPPVAPPSGNPIGTGSAQVNTIPQVPARSANLPDITVPSVVPESNIPLPPQPPSKNPARMVPIIAPALGADIITPPATAATPPPQYSDSPQIQKTGVNPPTTPAKDSLRPRHSQDSVATGSSSTTQTSTSTKPNCPRDSLWEKAIALLSPKDRETLGSPRYPVTYDDVLDEIKSERKRYLNEQITFPWKGETIVLRDVIEKVVNVVEKFKAVGDTIVQYDTGHLALPWAGFRFLLEVAVSDSGKMKAIWATLEIIGNLMGRCGVYEEMYLRTGTGTKPANNLEGEIVKLYSSVLQYFVWAKQYFQKNTAVRMVYSAVDDKEISLFEDISKFEASVLKEVEIAEAQYLRSVNKIAEKRISELKRYLRNFESSLRGIEYRVESLYSAVQDAERAKILDWLSQVKYREHHLNARDGRISGTGGWLTEKKEFKQWENTTESTILWLHGIPTGGELAGAGKTKITSMVVDRVDTFRKKGKDKALAYFYCRHDQTGQNDPCKILGAIARQLSCARPGFPLPPVLEAYEKARESDPAGPGSLRFGESLDLIISLINLYSETTIIIDALDECNIGNRKEFLRALKKLTRDSTSTIKIFVSSRDDDDILLELQDEPNVNIEPSDNKGDIQRFVVGEVTKRIKDKELLRGNVSKELKQTVVRNVVDGAQGMFLWVSLQVNEICDMRVEGDVREMLGKLPEGLEKAYTEIYQRIQTEKGSGPELARKALMWVLCSCRPFSPDELAGMISLPGAKVGKEVLFQLCHNFLTVDSQLGVVRFAHLSVREFLEKRDSIALSANAMAAEFCLSLILNQSNLISSSKSSSSHTYPQPFIQEYAVTYWPTHLRLCLDQQTDTKLSKLLGRFLGSLAEPSDEYIRWYKSAKSLLEKDSYQTDASKIPLLLDLQRLQGDIPRPILAACVFGFGEKIKDLWGSTPDSNYRNGWGESALYLASNKGYEWIVKTLLERGTGVNDTCSFPEPAVNGHEKVVELFNTEVCKYGNALQAAAADGHKKVVERLLEGGADVHAQGGRYGNALQAAAAGGHKEVVELLLGWGADVNVQGGQYGNALQAAATNGHDSIVSLLLDNGAKVNPQDSHLGNVLHEAAAGGHQKVVEILLDNGVEVNTKGGRYGNALQAAAAGGHLGVVGLLLDRKADVNAQGGHYGNALQAAAAKRHKKVVLLLLEHGAHINPQDAHFGDVLCLAVAKGNEAVVNSLLGQVAQAQAQDRGTYYGKVLYTAAANGRETVVRLVLKRRADVNTQGGIYGNALQAAAVNGHEKVVELLLKEGANADAGGGRYKSALHAAFTKKRDRIVHLLLAHREKSQVIQPSNEPDKAIASKREKVVSLLLEHGAKTNIQDDQSRNVLYVAAVNGYEKEVELLLENGADVNAQGGLYENALQAAARYGREKIVELLLDCGAHVNAKGGKYGDALRAALVNGHEEVVRMLLERDAKFSEEEKYGSALSMVAIEGHDKVVQMLLDLGADVNHQGGYYGNALLAASAYGNDAVVSILLDRGAEVNGPGGKTYGSALIAASIKGKSAVVDQLLRKGAKVNAVDSRYGNALYAAALNGHDRVVKRLLEDGAEVNAPNGDHGNPLSAAASNGYGAVVRLLLRAGADVNAQGGRYWSALSAAAVGGHHKVVRILLQGGAEVNAHGGRYANALLAAKLRGHKRVVKILRNYGAVLDSEELQRFLPGLLSDESGSESDDSCREQTDSEVQKKKWKMHREVVRILRRKGVAVSSRNPQDLWNEPLSEDDEKTDDVLQEVKRRRRERLLREKKGLGISLDLDIYDHTGSESDMPCDEKKVDDTDEEWGEDCS